MRMSSRSGKVYDLFKFILHFEDELSESRYENSMFGDAYFPYLDIPASVDANLSDILNRLETFPNNEWFFCYHSYVVKCQSKLRQQWKRIIDDYPWHWLEEAEKNRLAKSRGRTFDLGNHRRQISVFARFLAHKSEE